MKKTLNMICAAVLLGGLSACGETDVSRALTGALAGAAVADQTKSDLATGALIGATAGALCDDAGYC